MKKSVLEKRKIFRQMHDSGCFVMPNPWDIGSALYLQSLGFKALGTTSAGVAWSKGRPDGELTRYEVLAHMEEMAAATELPVNADFENGFSDTAEGVYRNVKLAIETGVAGLSIEDSTGNSESPLYPVEVAVERIRAARQAIDDQGGDVYLIGRAENFFIGRPDLADALVRLKAYSEAGADCLYAPGIKTPEEIRTVIRAVHPKPINLLVNQASGLAVTDYEAMGVRRISLGSSMATSAWATLNRVSEAIANEGSFRELAGAMPGRELNALFRKH